MRITGLILFLSLLRGVLPAQQTYFSKNYDMYGTTSHTGSIIQTPDSGFAFLSSNFVQPYLGYTFIRTDKFGDTLFTKRFVYTNNSFGVGDGPSAFILANDGNYIACGTGTDGTNGDDAYIIKFTPSGDTLWTKRFGGTGDDFMNSMYQDANDNFWVCGSTSSQGNGIGDFWLVKLDANCTMLWDSVYGTVQNEGAACGELTLDGGFILSGRSGNNPYVVKVDSVGFPQWQFIYPAYNGYGYITQMADSGYIMGCAKVLSATETQASLIKLNSSGTESWVRYTGFVNYHDVITTKPILTDSTIVAAGDSRPNGGYYEGYLVKTDLNGYMLWQRRYVKNVNNPHYFYDCIPTYDHGYVMGGTCLMSTQDAWLIKVDSMGCEVAGCDAVGLIEPENQNAISVYPNPSHGNVTVTSARGNEDGVCVEVMNSMGQIVDRISFNGLTAVQLITENYGAGLFYLRLMSNGTCISTEKLLIVK